MIDRPRRRELVRRTLVLLVNAAIVFATASIFAPRASAGAFFACYGCKVKDNIYVGLTKKQTQSLPKFGKATVKEHGKTVARRVPYEYRMTLACPTNISPERAQVGCEKAFKTCIDIKDAEGPLEFVFRRLVVPKKGAGGWENIGQTCWPRLVPNAKSKPELTVAMIRSEFAKTPFVKPRATMEPVGNRTLVNLPSYFTADFSGAGYGPGEVRVVTLLGHKVQIKPVLTSNTFHFGDGSSLGPTASRGGGYPDGDVKHTYLERGTVQASVTTVYGGQFAVDGGEFTDLPGTATITGPGQLIQVLEAKGRLVR